MGEKVRGAQVLDLYAGSGSLGIEALSRGAEEVLFIDSSQAAVEVIEKNLKDLDISDKANVIKGSVINELYRLAESGLIFDLIFLDPPYSINVAKLRDVFSLMTKCCDSTGLIILEFGTDLSESLVTSIKEIDKRKYGVTRVYFFKKQTNASSQY